MGERYWDGTPGMVGLRAVIAEILKELIAAGLQGESLIAAVERIEQAQPKAIDATAERRRAKDRERYHLRKPQKTPTPPKSTETALSSTSSVETIVSKVESKKERARKSLLPATWLPKPSHYELAKKYGKSPEYVDLKAEELRDWAVGKGVMRADWDRTLNTFIRPKEGQSNGHGGSRPLQDDSKSISRAAGRLAEAAQRGEFTFGPRPSLLPQPDTSAVLVLPKR